jgi:hypothetical protein
MPSRDGRRSTGVDGGHHGNADIAAFCSAAVLPQSVPRVEPRLPAYMAPVLSVLLAHRCFKPLPLS